MTKTIKKVMIALMVILVSVVFMTACSPDINQPGGEDGNGGNGGSGNDGGQEQETSKYVYADYSGHIYKATINDQEWSITINNAPTRSGYDTAKDISEEDAQKLDSELSIAAERYNGLNYNTTLSTAGVYTRPAITEEDTEIKLPYVIDSKFDIVTPSEYQHKEENKKNYGLSWTGISSTIYRIKVYHNEYEAYIEDGQIRYVNITQFYDKDNNPYGLTEAEIQSIIALNRLTFEQATGMCKIQPIYTNGILAGMNISYEDRYERDLSNPTADANLLIAGKDWMIY